MRVELQPRRFRFRSPLRAAWGTLAHRDVLVLSLTDDDALTGRGEAAPLEPYDGVSLDRAAAALEAYRPVLESAPPRSRGSGPRPAGAAGSPPVAGQPPFAGQPPSVVPPLTAAPPRTLLDACREADPLPQALAAVDMALWDLGARRRSAPVCTLLAGDPARAVPVNASITAADRSGAAAQAQAAVAAGYACLKVKVGLGDDAGRVAAVRAAAGPDVLLRLDANAAWSREEAVRMIETLAPAGLELVEEPVRGLAAMRWVRERVSVRIAMDETASEPGALASGAADAVCLKVAARAGISGVLAAATLVRTSGAEAYLSSTYDGPYGIAAGVHAAAALRTLGDVPPCGLATLGLFEDVIDPFVPVGGAIETPQAPGLGVD